jgi:replicative DNA helicase
VNSKPFFPSTLPLPHSEDSERALLCSFILAPGTVASICARVLPRDAFYIPAHRHIFDALFEWPEPGRRVDFIWLCEKLKEDGHFAECGGKEYLSEIYDVVPGPENAEYNLKTVLEKYHRRRILILGDEIGERAMDLQEDAYELAADANRRIQAILNSANGDHDIAYDDSALPSGEEDTDKTPFPLDALPSSFRTPIEEVMRHFRVPALLPRLLF